MQIKFVSALEIQLSLLLEWIKGVPVVFLSTFELLLYLHVQLQIDFFVPFSIKLFEELLYIILLLYFYFYTDMKQTCPVNGMYSLHY